MIRTYKYKLYKTKKLKHLHDTINISGIIYNHCIALHKRYYKLYGKHLNKFQLQKHLTKLKKREHHIFWSKVPSQAVQNITERIDEGYKKFFKYATKKTKLNRTLSKKKKGSNNRKKAKLQLVKIHIRTANQRRDYFHKLSNQLANNYDTIFIEDLNMKAMQMMWGRKISDLAFSEFVNILEYKANVTKIDRFFPSSKMCSTPDCGFVLKELDLKIREWTCPSCNTNHLRDVNAAINIKRVGTSTLRGETVRPAFVG